MSIHRRGLGRLAAVLLAALPLSGCDKLYTDPTSAQKVLERAGYSEIRFTGYQWLACSKDDAYRTGFVAKGPAGAVVSGVVCKSIFKNSTIRFAD